MFMAAALMLFSSNITAAPNTYRYQDSAGATHIGDSVPPELVNNGYEILNERGRVVDVVLPRSALDARTTEALKKPNSGISLSWNVTRMKLYCAITVHRRMSSAYEPESWKNLIISSPCKKAILFHTVRK